MPDISEVRREISRSEELAKVFFHLVRKPLPYDVIGLDNSDASRLGPLFMLLSDVADEV